MKKMLGVLALVLVFGMTVVGCDNGSTNGGNTDNKIIKITGIPSEFLTATLCGIRVDDPSKAGAARYIAMADAYSFSENTLTFNLREPKIENNSVFAGDIPWSGNGIFDVMLVMFFPGDIRENFWWTDISINKTISTIPFSSHDEY